MFFGIVVQANTDDMLLPDYIDYIEVLDLEEDQGINYFLPSSFDDPIEDIIGTGIVDDPKNITSTTDFSRFGRTGRIRVVLKEPLEIYAYTLKENMAALYGRMAFYYDGKVVSGGHKGSLNAVYTEIDPVNTDELIITNTRDSSVGIRLSNLQLFGNSLSKPNPPDGVEVVTGYNELYISWESRVGLKYYIYVDGEKLSNDPIEGDSYTLKNLVAGQKYIIEVTAFNPFYESDKSNQVEGIPLELIISDISKLKKEQSSSYIRLSWENPSFDTFSHVNIYRKMNNIEVSSSLLENFFFGSIVYANDDFQKIFSTNGTWWEDHTVQKGSSYEYLLKVEDENGIESSGLVIEAMAVSEPPKPPENIGTESGADENGKYLLIEWDPVDGVSEYEIIIDGETITVYPPDTSYKYYHDGTKNRFNVRVISVGDDGQKSIPKMPPSFGSVDHNITVGSVVKSTVGYIMLFGSFMLLGLILLYSPVIIDIFKEMIRKFRNA